MRTLPIGIAISCSILAAFAQAQTPSFTASTVLNGASLAAGPIAPGEVVAIMGTNLGDPNFPGNCTSQPLPSTCTAVNVLVNGVAAPKLYDSATEVVFQAPFNLTGTTATVQVTSNLSGAPLSSAMVPVPVAPTAPGIFTASSSRYGSNVGLYYDASSAGLFPSYSQPVQVGDTVVMYGTGFGVTNPAVATGALGPNSVAGAVASVTMTINNQSVFVTVAGLEPGNVSNASIGNDELVFTVPSNLSVPATSPQALFAVVVTVGGVASAPVNLVVEAPPPSITSIAPNPLPLSASPQTVTFTGTGFQSGLTLTVYDPSNHLSTIPAAGITVVSSTQFTAQITTGTTAGTWSAYVTDPDGVQSETFVFSASGTAAVPTITSIVTTSSLAPVIAQNTWIEIHGTLLTTATATVWDSYFVNNPNTLPTTLAGVSVTVDGKPAAIFYCGPGTGSPTQINVLSPIDSALGPVQVTVTTPSGQMVSQSVNEGLLSPALLVKPTSTGNYVAALHIPSYNYLGPASLSANGYIFTPAVPGETITIYATGFGVTVPPLTNQFGGPFDYGTSYPLPTPWPTVTIGNLPATVTFAKLASPGLYQLNVVVPQSAPNGDLPIVATYNSISTQGGALITVQH